MDAYPQHYVGHNLPFVLLSGLETTDAQTEPKTEETLYPFLNENPLKIESDYPILNGPVAEELRSVFLSEDASRAPWDPLDDAFAGDSKVEFKIKSVGRNHRLPPRKAKPPPASPPTSPIAGQDHDVPHGSSVILHAPISPLTPSSPTFPDGIMTPLWVAKHQDLVPAAVINFFPFCLDPTMSSLRDNQLKIEINGMKKEWSSSGYKTRFVVVLLSEEANGDDLEDVEDRVLGIRRATNLEQKSIFLLPPDVTSEEMREFTKSLLSLLQPLLIEYYRDLSKHARRKRNRSSIPPPTAPPTSGTSQTLSLQGWNTRYEFKLGIFAEFRREIDAALKNYESAYETLFGQEVFENIAGWDPRFNDARLLADALAIRIIRCLLLSGHTTAAVKCWVNHRSRSQDIVNRRGKGTRNYGWEAWEARWSMVMAQLIHQARIPHLTSVGISQDQFKEHNSIFVPHEKTFPPGDEIAPWEQLHHEGYWLYRSAKHTMYRRALAEQIPEEDRMPPGQSPASQIASKAYLYDTYLAPETHIEVSQTGRGGFDHSSLILGTLRAALAEFSRRDQVRMMESLGLEISEEYIRLGSWSEAYDILRPLWVTLTWRRSGWWQLMEKFAWALRECALRIQDGETILRVDWELLSWAFPSRPDWHYNIHQSLADLSLAKPKPSIVVKAEDVVSCVAATFVFQKAEGNVGEPLQGQLVLSSCAQKSSAPVRFAELKLAFEGCLRPIRLQSDQSTDADVVTPCIISSPSLRDPSVLSDSSVLQSPTSGFTALTGIADLTIGPSQTKIYNLTCIPREAGESRVASVALLVEEEKFDLTCAITDLVQRESFWWQQTSRGTTRRRVGKARDINRCKILPKPPKIRIKAPNIKDTYYTNERIVLRLVIHNEEDQAADVLAEARLFGRTDSTAKISWLDEENTSNADPSSGSNIPVEEASHFIKRSIGVMESSSQRELAIVLANTEDSFEYELEISTVYNLVSDVHTPIIATTRLNMSIIRPFEANYEFLPRLHPQPWPNFFTVDDDLIGPQQASNPGGLRQKWCLDTKVVSFAREPLVIEQMSVVLLSSSGGATSQIGSEVVVSSDVSEIHPEELRQSNFVMDVQKIVLGDRRATTLNLALKIQWQRSDSDEGENSTVSSGSTTTTLEIPRFIIPAGEPRVLASAIPSHKFSGLIHVEYTLENPSLHFLTFNMTMEASEHFAFSGPKTMVVQLAPVSRHTVRYNLLASKRGLWIQPQLLVVDTYFNKSLRVLPTEDMRSDKKGILIWVDAED
ncbi:Gryzun, putative trafficking through golgi-domain-containing protein [Aspergillus cavernicola]|uniref:Gryzun, putative trafficking through golgi-domain-containing protein n=1 Tax=Aspergillus cavernicola TaxID=176166 RepID=A0ABR4IW48_9EURO